MNRLELMNCMGSLKLSSSEMAKLLSVDPKTVERWLKDEVQVSGPAAQALRAWMRLDKLGLPWRPADHMIGLSDEEIAAQIRLLREHNVGLDSILQKVRERGEIGRASCRERVCMLV